MSLFDAIADFFYMLVFNDYDGFDFLNYYSFQIGGYYDNNVLVPAYMTLREWLTYTATIISIAIIVVLCCLFVYKIVRLIGGLIR